VFTCYTSEITEQFSLNFGIGGGSTPNVV